MGMNFWELAHKDILEVRPAGNETASFPKGQQREGDWLFPGQV
jgi:hypothetical protein